jgi:hypothetical protein
MSQNLPTYNSWKPISLSESSISSTGVSVVDLNYFVENSR